MKNKKVPMRRCIACMESKPKNQLIRITLYDGELSLDNTGRAKGRGSYLCKSIDCLKLAEKRRSIQRALQGDLKPEQLEKLCRDIEEAIDNEQK